jgi:hypothetical protein
MAQARYRYGMGTLGVFSSFYHRRVRIAREEISGN